MGATTVIVSLSDRQQFIASPNVVFRHGVATAKSWAGPRNCCAMRSAARRAAARLAGGVVSVSSRGPGPPGVTPRLQRLIDAFYSGHTGEPGLAERDREGLTAQGDHRVPVTALSAIFFLST